MGVEVGQGKRVDGLAQAVGDRDDPERRREVNLDFSPSGHVERHLGRSSHLPRQVWTPVRVHGTTNATRHTTRCKVNLR